MKQVIALVCLLPATFAYSYVGGKVSRPGDFPATVALRELKCGGVKIAPRAYLTAAHCLLPRGPYPLLAPGSALGLHPSVNRGETGPVIANVKKVAIHPSFFDHIGRTMDPNASVGQAGVHDLAVITVDKDIAEVEVTSLDFSPIAPGTEVIVGGYGCQSMDEAEWGILNAYRKGPVTYKTAVKLVSKKSAENFAVPAEDKDSKSFSTGCHGDSGGPAYRRSGGKLTVIGINSFVTGELWLHPDGSLEARSEDVSMNLARIDLPKVKAWLEQAVSEK